jgi:hypothetical protein
LFILVALVACVLNLDPIFLADFYPWVRITIPAALLIGLAGKMQASRSVAFATAVIAWIGILAMFLTFVVGAVPGEMSRLLQGPGGPPANSFLFARFALLIGLGVLVTILFARTPGAARRTNPADYFT